MAAAPQPRRVPGAQATRTSQPVRRPPMGETMLHEPVGDAFGLNEPETNATKRKGGGAISVVLQFVVGLMIIVGVAALVVWLWMKYYQS